MRKKTKILLSSYLAVLVIALGLYAWAGQWGLGWFRRTAEESASLAYEETVRAVQTLAAVLEQSPYATDSDMCDRICCEAYASAAAAESALSTLPFSTWELEQLSGFLNTAGDYSHSLCGQGQPFTQRQRRELRTLSDAAGDFSQRLLELRQNLQDRELIMDSREKRLRNVGEETGPRLSEELKQWEDGFDPVELCYDGAYGAEEEKKSGGLLTEEEMLAAAAAFVGLQEEDLCLDYQAEGGEGRRCYRAEEAWISVGRGGVESYSQSRLVPETVLSLDEAEKKAKAFLTARGYADLRLLERSQNACIALFSYVREQDGVLCPEDPLRLSIALDDGSLYSFDATKYDPEPVSVSWAVEEDGAREALPASLREASCVRMILRSPGGRPVPCYVFSARDEDGRAVEISVSAENGKQFRIRVGA